jgi:biotin carboxyl carrier protein
MVVKLIVVEGDLVKKGDKIIIIEAMKMENSLISPIAGVIKSIKVKEGTPVEKDAVLIEIESLI